VHPAAIARQFPDRAAVIMARTGEQISYQELAERASRLAHLFRERGLRRGSHAAVLLPNHCRYAEIIWAAHISGVYLTPVNAHLTAGEAGYIINDCGAELVVTSAGLSAVAAGLNSVLSPRVTTRLMADGQAGGWDSYEAAVSVQPAGPIPDPSRGGFMFYSSGTTGRPKGIDKKLEEGPLDEGPGSDGMLRLLGLRPNQEVFLVPGPLYHSAAANYAVMLQRAGATVVLMERFDAADVLRLIEQYKITFAQFVPTHFIRLLRLPAEVRAAADVSSLRSVVHAAAPCPADVKRAMIDWWGPIIREYYAATEGIGLTFIGAREWLEHPGSVGRAVFGEPHILDADGNELPPGVPGDIWFAGTEPIVYHNDPEKSAAARNGRGFTSVGDVGYLDADGYLYLTDRRSYMIVSGGVNIYPREVEDRLASHPRVADAAVFGVPNAEFGEEVKAVVQPTDWADAGPEFAAELITYCRAGLAGYKCPRSVDFERQLPRTDAGKLNKRDLRDRYLARSLA
jgi:acyl-CoA synthetase (AMP-forming)/AMP-acid ligase II